jgi:hypothetical protein
MPLEQSRRRFLQAGVGLGVLASLPRSLALSSVPDAPGPRPSLLFGPADIPRIRATLARPEFAAFWRSCEAADLRADERFLRDEIRLTNVGADLARAANILLRSAFVHVLEPEPRHLRIARLALSRVMEYRRWDWVLEAGQYPVGVMRGPSVCVSVILASDWLGGALSEAEQEQIVRRLGEDGGPACHRAVFGETEHDKVAGWSVDPAVTGVGPVDVCRWPEILDRTNLRIIATAGLAAVACFLRGRHPEADRWCSESVASLRLFASRMPPDRSFPEQVGYWSYTFSFYALAIELLRRTRGIDERGTLDFPAMARYALAMAAPTIGRATDCINIGDGSAAASAVPLSWIAREFRDGTAQYLSLRPESVSPGDATACLAAIWFDAGIPPRIAADAPLDRQCAPGLVISRSGWRREDGVVCLRSGGPANHEHADRNSVIFMAHGERLLTDPLHASYSRSDPKWILRLTQAHTAVLIGGKGHVYLDDAAGTHSTAAAATLLDHRVGPDWMCATSEAAEAYRLAGVPARRVARTLVFLKPDVLLLFDQVDLDRPGSVQVRFQVYNDDGQGRVRADGTSFRIERPNASLFARFASRGGTAGSTGRLDLPADGGIYPFAEITSAPARSHTILTVCLATPAAAQPGSFNLATDADSWDVRGAHRGRAFAVRIKESAVGGPPSVLI